ncbi:MAG: VOC family protein [Candidatus Eiseniibacteriota bacterium]
MSDIHHKVGESFEISPRTSIAHVKLRVNDIQRSLDFYEQLLGFELVERFPTKIHSSVHTVTTIRNFLFFFQKWLTNIPLINDND